MPRPKKDVETVEETASRGPTVVLTFDDAMFERIETYRFDNRFEDRAGAVRALIESGLTAWEGERN
jgi:hypothetical protein